jgi:hypothetical protein
MKTKYLLVYSLALLSFVITSGCKSHVKTASSENSVTSKEELIKRGSYLVSSIGCGDCHSPKINGPQGLVVIDSLSFPGFPGIESFRNTIKKSLSRGGD